MIARMEKTRMEIVEVVMVKKQEECWPKENWEAYLLILKYFTKSED